jgi:hypothetical protein
VALTTHPIYTEVKERVELYVYAPLALHGLFQGEIYFLSVILLQGRAVEDWIIRSNVINLLSYNVSSPTAFIFTHPSTIFQFLSFLFYNGSNCW